MKRIKKFFSLLLGIAIIISSFSGVRVSESLAESFQKPGWDGWKGTSRAVKERGPDGRIFVNDLASSSIRVYDKDENLLQTIGEVNVTGSDNNHFNYQADIAIHPNGDLYVADRWNYRVQVYRANSQNGLYTYLSTISLSSDVLSVSVDSSGLVYVTVDDRSTQQPIRVYDKDGVFQYGIAAFSAMDVAFDSSNYMYVASYWGNVIYKFTKDESGLYVKDPDQSKDVFYGDYNPNTTNNTGKLNLPISVDVGQQGQVYISDTKGVHLVDSNGTFQKKVVNNAGGIFYSQRVHVLQDGLLWIANYSKGIAEFDADGNYIRMLGEFVIPNEAPAAHNVNLNSANVYRVGKVIEGSYEYSDKENDSEGISSYQWYIADDQLGTNKQMIVGATETSMTLNSDSLNKYISLEVTPVAVSGTTLGTAVASPFYGPIMESNEEPVASDVIVTGAVQSGGTLTATYRYSDVDGDPEGESSYRWYYSSDASGSDRTLIAEATAKTLELQEEWLGMYIYFEVMPVATEGILAGKSVMTPAIGPIGAANLAPTARDVKITGEAQVGQTLTGSYVFDDADSDVEGETLFKWYVSEDANGTNKTEIQGAATQSLVLQATLQGKYVSFEVTPVAATGTELGSPVQSRLTSAVAKAADSNSDGNTGGSPGSSSGGGSGGGATGGAGNPSSTQEILVDVETGISGNIVSKTKVLRKTEADGKKKDHVTLQTSVVEEAQAKAKGQGTKAIRVVIPDVRDEVSEVKVDVPKASLQSLKSDSNDLELSTANMRIMIPGDSLATFTDDLYFRFIPIKEQAKRLEVEERAKKEEIIKKIAQSDNLSIWGRPMTVETNMENRPVTVYMPLGTLPSDDAKRKDLLDHLVIFIEHDDGTKELVQGELSEFAPGMQGMKFNISKFSTFSMVYLPGWKSEQNLSGAHKVYIKGYNDGSFRPQSAILRAELAAMLGRNMRIDSSSKRPIQFKDVADGYWALEEINRTSQSGIIAGFKDGTFRPKAVVTRAQMAAIVARWVSKECELDASAFAACGKPSGAKSFADVKDDYWAADEIQIASAFEFMVGNADNTFRPEDPLTRAEAVKVMNRLFKRGPLYGDLMPTFSDVSSGSWAFHEIEEAATDHFWYMEKDQEVKDKNTDKE